LRSAAEIDLAGAMNAGTQRAEQRALYASADRRLKAAVDFFQSHAMPVRAQYATNMRAVLAVSTTDYDSATKLLERSIEMARANGDVAEQRNLSAILPPFTTSAAFSRSLRRNTKSCCRSSIRGRSRIHTLPFSETTASL
jgi:hypothetical protein